MVCFQGMLLLLVFVSFTQSQWVSTYRPVRTRYVAASVSLGTGSGTIADPLNLESAMNRGFGSAGDEFLVGGGVYTPTVSTGLFAFKCDGNVTHPCVFRCQTGQRCTLRGLMHVYANYVWLWGFEINDLLGLAGGRSCFVFVCFFVNLC
jgi:hypothetical protein